MSEVKKEDVNDDQYASGAAADVWEYYVGSKDSRTSHYRKWLVDVLAQYNCSNVVDVACGTGVDSVLLLEAGFNVTSTDASYQMLKFALKRRWSRRKEQAFDQWEIEEANWTSQQYDMKKHGLPSTGYDAVICLGNSFAHLIDYGDEKELIKQGLRNFYGLLKPGGVLIIDHRNYDAALDLGGTVEVNNVYYPSKFHVEIETDITYRNGKPCMLTLHYQMDVPRSDNKKPEIPSNQSCNFKLSYYPHRLLDFNDLLKQVFGGSAKHDVYGDFQPIDSSVKPTSGKFIPGFIIHVIHKC